MPSGVSKINHILSKGTYGRNQAERDKYLQDLIDNIGSQIESNLLASLNIQIPNSSTFSQISGSAKNTGGSTTTTPSSVTKEVETIGPQVVFNSSTTSTGAASNSSGQANNISTGSVASTTANTANTNTQGVSNNTNNSAQQKSLTDNSIATLVQSLFNIGGSTVNDQIKSIKGYYYVVENNKLIFFKAKDIVSKFFNLTLINSKKTKDKNPFSSKIMNNNGFISTSEQYTITFNNPVIKDFTRLYFPQIYSNIKLRTKFVDTMLSEMIIYINKNVLNKIYDDYSFSYQAPFDVKQVSDSNLGNSLVYDIESQYNFYTQPYESITQTSTVNERVLPNLYYYISEEVQEQKSSFKLNHTTLNKRIKLENIDDEYYYINWSNTLSNIQTASALDSISFPLLNTIYQKKDFTALQDKNLDRELFPMCNGIQFSMTNADMNIVENINNTAFSVPLYNSLSAIIPVASSMESISGLFDLNQANNPNITDDVILLENTLTVIEKPGLNDTLLSNYNQKSMRVVSFDLFEQISGSIQNINNYSIPKRKGFDILNYFSNFESVDDSPIYRIIEPLKIKGNIKNSIEKHQRTYQDFIQNTDLVDSETMFYRVSKFRVANNGTTTTRQYVQSYTIPNFQDITKFIQYDTQVKYNTTYEYVVAAYQAVIGSEYEYVSDSSSTSNNIVLNAISCPILKLVETPYFVKSIYVKDSAPIEPDVRIVFFKDISNIVKFMLNSQVSTKYAKPIIIENKDQDIFESIRKAQQAKEILKFESEDPPAYFEVYRLEQKPTKYLDFTGFNRFKVIPKFGSYASDIVDVIEPNKKYYYIFRVSDVHEHISNPTDCFEIEIVNDNGKIFPIINVIKLEEQKIDNKIKELKRFIHIKPSSIQTEVKLKDEENESSAINNQIVLGSESNSLWGKKIKVRVKSKLSNKMVDFNIYFNKQHIISKDEKDLTS